MLETLRRYLRYTSWPILLAMLTLIAMGLVTIRLTEQGDGAAPGLSKMERQMIFAGVAMVAFVVATAIPYQKLGRFAYPLFALTLVLLIIVLVETPLTQARKGSSRWIGVHEFSVQPSEVAKIGYIVLLAWYLRYRDNYRRLTGLLVPFALTLLPMGLILKEPDLGTSLLFLPTLFFMLIMAGARMWHMLVILGLGLMVVLFPLPRAVDSATIDSQREQFVTRDFAGVTFYSIDPKTDPAGRPDLPIAYCRFQVGSGNVYDLQPASIVLMTSRKQNRYQADRIKAWLRPDDPAMLKGKGFQPRMSRMVLGSGGWTGRSGWNDSDLFFLALPEDHTDFIFAVIGGQWGFVGCLAVLFLYAVIFVFGIEIAVTTDDPFGRLLAVGVVSLLFTQMFINMGMAMGLMPVTGMTLPFVSYGGSSLVINCAALGLLINVGQRRPILLGPKPFEYNARRERDVPLGTMGRD